MTSLEPVDEAPAAELDAPPASPSLLDRLRAQRNETVDDRTCLRPIPGWHGVDVVVRYRYVPWAQARSQATSSGRSSARTELATMSDLLIRACVEVFAREPGSERLERLTEPGDPEPVRFDARLMAALGREPHAPTARASLLQAFKGNDVAIMAEGSELLDWLRGLEAEADEAALGE